MRFFSALGGLCFLLMLTSCQQVIDGMKMNKVTELMNTGKYKKALELCNKEIIRKPEEASNYDIRCTIYNTLGNYEAALKDINKSYLLDSVNFSFLQRADIQSELGNFDHALADIKKEQSINGDSKLLYGSLANVFFLKEEYEAALNKITDGIKKYPNDAYLYNFKGFINMEIEDYKEAIFYFDKAIEFDEFYGIAYNNRGFCKYNLGLYELAEEDVSKSLEFNAGNALAHRNMGLIQIKLDKKEEGCAALQKALEFGYEDIYGVDINIDIIIYCN